MYNHCSLVGRLTKDPELKKTQNGVAVVSFNLAVSRNYIAEDGSRPVDFIDCVAYRNVAENIAKYCRKGSQVLVDGSLQTRYYEHPNKVNIKIYEVIVNNILFLESKKSVDKPGQAVEEKEEITITESDLPF